MIKNLENEEFLTLEEVSRIIHIPKKTISQYCYRRQIPFLRITGKTVLFNKREIEEWLNARYVASRNST